MEAPLPPRSLHDVADAHRHSSRNGGMLPKEQEMLPGGRCAATAELKIAVGCCWKDTGEWGGMRQGDEVDVNREEDGNVWLEENGRVFQGA